MRSPTGCIAVPAEGPLDAELVFVGESPAVEECEQGRPFVGRAGRLLNAMLAKVGLPRERCRLVNAVPVRAPGDRFARHDPRDLEWGLELLNAELQRAVAAGARLIVPLGDNPLSIVAPHLPHPPSWSDDEGESNKQRSRIGVWRGSLVPYGEAPTLQTYERLATTPQAGPYVLPTYHPAAVLRQFAWHPWFLLDLQRAKRFLDGRWEWPRARKWVIDQPDLLDDYVSYLIEVEHAAFVDTEMSPFSIVAVAGEAEVHVFEWGRAAEAALNRLFASPWVLIGGHNLGHDLTYLRSIGLQVEPVLAEGRSIADTGGFAHALDSSLLRNLSPGLSTRFTSWPYHKWLVEHDPLRYCGFDAIVAADGYWGALRSVCNEGLLHVVEHDHQLLKRLLRMQWRGVAVDEEARQTAVEALIVELEEARGMFRKMAEPVVRSRLHRMEKPHLFFTKRQCQCCGGGKVQRQHCVVCGLGEFVKLTPLEAKARGFRSLKAMKESLPPCRNCEANGKEGVWEEVNPDSTDQVADILYRGYGIRARRYKGKETIRADQLAPLAEKYPIVEALLRVSKLDADRQTLERLEPDYDGRLHCVFDPWGTGRGRTASSEGLVQKGTNLQNVPKKHRYVIVADPGKLIVAPDMEQIEGRAIAVITGDEALKRAYTEPVDWPGHARHGRIDSHTKLIQALLPYGFELSRDQSKKASYAGWYGAEAGQLAVELTAEARRKGEGIEVTVPQAQRILDLICRQLYPGIQKWHNSVVTNLLAGRTLVSPTGRRARWNGYITRKVRNTTELIEKVAKEGWSFFPQDMAAWVLALGLQALEREGAGLIEPIFHVHDELGMLIPASPGTLVDEALSLIQRCMTVEQWGMVFPVDVGKPAPNWRCAKGIHDGDGACRLCGALAAAHAA